MILDQLTELNILTVMNRGEPNKECIAINVSETINTAQFGILLGFTKQIDGIATPFQNYFFWFGENVLNKGDWVFIYTGSGKPSAKQSDDDSHNIYTLYWNQPNTLFHNPNIVPMLFKMSEIQVLSKMSSL
jgi:hypothetical protein